MIILGIDPGSVITGYAIINKQKGTEPALKVIDFGCIITDKFFTTGERLKKIYKEVTKLIEKYKPDLICLAGFTWLPRRVRGCAAAFPTAT